VAGPPALVLARVEGTPLSAWIRRPHGADLVERLRLALGLTLARHGDARDGEDTLQYMAPEQTAASTTSTNAASSTRSRRASPTSRRNCACPTHCSDATISAPSSTPCWRARGPGSRGS